MFKIEELSGSLIRSGRFVDAIPAFNRELQFAINRGCITLGELFSLNTMFCNILLNPSDYDEVAELSDKMIKLALRIPDFVPVVCSDYEENVKASREVK
jgi:hypothetical protein